MGKKKILTLAIRLLVFGLFINSCRNYPGKNLDIDIIFNNIYLSESNLQLDEDSLVISKNKKYYIIRFKPLKNYIYIYHIFQTKATIVSHL